MQASCSYLLVWRLGCAAVGGMLFNLILTTITLPLSTRRGPICLSTDGPVRREIRSTLDHLALRRGIGLARTRDGFDDTNIPHLNVPSM